MYIDSNLEKKLSKGQKDRLLELKLKINEAKTLNNRAILEEQRNNLTEEQKKLKENQVYEERRKEKLEELQFKGIDQEKKYMNYTAQQQEHYDSKKKHQVDNFGWNVFNDDALYTAYKKRCANLPFNEDQYKQQMDELISK